MPKTQTPRKQKRKSLASRDHLARLIRNLNAQDVPSEPEASSSSSAESSSSQASAKKIKGATPTLDYDNVLLIERLQAAVESRASTCQRLEQLIRTSPAYSPAMKSRLIRCLRDDFIRGDKTRRIIEDLRRSDFISTKAAEDEVENMRKGIAENTRILLEGSKELQTIGDHIATHFS